MSETAAAIIIFIFLARKITMRLIASINWSAIAVFTELLLSMVDKGQRDEKLTAHPIAPLRF
jgi:hypothetical protein